MEVPSSESCPCYNCICVPVCRHKMYADLYLDCINLVEWAMKYEKESIGIYRLIVKNVLKPSNWDTNKDGKVCKMLAGYHNFG